MRRTPIYKIFIYFYINNKARTLSDSAAPISKSLSGAAATPRPGKAFLLLFVWGGRRPKRPVFAPENAQPL